MGRHRSGLGGGGGGYTKEEVKRMAKSKRRYSSSESASPERARPKKKRKRSSDRRSRSRSTRRSKSRSRDRRKRGRSEDEKKKRRSAIFPSRSRSRGRGSAPAKQDFRIYKQPEGEKPQQDGRSAATGQGIFDEFVAASKSGQEYDYKKMHFVKNKQTDDEMIEMRPGEKKRAMGFAADRINDDNVGHLMLIKFGWKEGDGLGKHGQGIPEPLLYTARQDRLGLGRDTEDRREMAKKVQWRKMLVKTLTDDLARAKRKLARMDHKPVSLGEYEAFDEDDNYIGRINEWAQRNSITCCDTLPNFRMIQMMGQTHDPTFKFECQLTIEGDRLKCLGAGRTKKVAKKRAAFECLQEITKRGFRSDYGEVKLELLRIITELRNRHCYCLWCETKYPSMDVLKEECPNALEQNCSRSGKYKTDTEKAMATEGIMKKKGLKDGESLL